MLASPTIDESTLEPLTLVTRNVAKSSLSPNLLPPILSPAGLSPRSAGGTYDPLTPALPAAPAAAPAAGSSARPAAGSAAPFAPTGAIVSLYGQRAVKCSPEQIRHLTFLSLSLSLSWSASLASSLASLRQLMLGRKMMFSPTDVVSVAGPLPSLAESPNLAHVLRSATRGFTVSLWVM